MSVGSTRATASHDRANRLAGSVRGAAPARASGADGDGGAQGRRPAARQQGVGQHESGHRDGPVPLTHAEPPQHPPQRDRQDHEVLAGDRQGVDDAGANELVPFRLRHGGTFAQDERRRRAGRLRRERGRQRPPTPTAHRRRPPRERRRPAALQPRHAVGRLRRRQLGANALVAPRRGGVGLAGVGRAGDRRQPAHRLHLVPGVQIERRPRDH